MILISSQGKIKVISASFIFSLFSIFPLVFMINEDFNFFLNFIKYTFPIIIFFNVLALFENRVSFSFFAIIFNFLFLALSCLASLFLAAKLNSTFHLFLFFIIIYIGLFIGDNYLLLKNNYFFKYREVFYKNIINGYYSFDGNNEFEELKKYRKNTNIPKIQIIYLILLPLLFIFKSTIFKVSSDYSSLSSSLGISIILSFCFVYAFGAAMIFVQDLFLKWYFSVNYEG